ncbi:MAG: hypothetical protein SVR08_17385, partial [Spirochaetota bacterium]|nr:hypothetical protein [Spirochaetota bacterium]
MKDKTFSIKTLGCKLNQYDSSLIATQFSKNGWIARPFGTWVDLVIINTCTVTNRSDKKCRNYIRQGAGFSRSGKVLVTGCLVDRNPDDLKKMPEVYKLFKNAEKDKIFDHIDSSLKQIDFSINSDAAPISTINQLEEIRKNSCDDKEINVEVPFSRTRGFIKIQDGCDG